MGLHPIDEAAVRARRIIKKLLAAEQPEAAVQATAVMAD